MIYQKYFPGIKDWLKDGGMKLKTTRMHMGNNYCGNILENRCFVQ